MQAGERVLITGATSGLGREMAIQLAQRGCRLAITGRREKKLAETARLAQDAGAEVMPLIGSVTKIGTVREHYDRIFAAWEGLDYAILNAGVADSEDARQFDARNYRWTFETNVFGVCNWLEVVIPDMIEQGSGVIAGISSPGGWRGFPQTGAYASSKAAVSTILESVRVDLRGTGVDIVIVCPGWVRSEITDRNAPGSMYMLLETEDGVRRALRGIEKRRRVVHFPFPLTHLVRYVIKPMPGWLYDRLISKVVRRDKSPYIDESTETPR